MVASLHFSEMTALILLKTVIFSNTLTEQKICIFFLRFLRNDLIRTCFCVSTHCGQLIIFFATVAILLVNIAYLMTSVFIAFVIGINLKDPLTHFISFGAFLWQYVYMVQFSVANDFLKFVFMVFYILILFSVSY